MNSSSRIDLPWVLDETPPPGAEQFEGYFRLICGNVDKKPENYNDVVELLNLRVASMGGPLPSDEYRREKISLARREYLNGLRKVADDIVSGEVLESTLLVSVGRLEGKYATIRNQVDRREGATLHPPDHPKTLFLAPLDEGATPEMQSLFVDVERILSVVEIVLSRREKSRKWWKGDSGGKEIETMEASAIRKRYLQRLKEIADEGLVSPVATVYASRKLELYKEAFVAREADYVKNEHVRSLGFSTLTVIVILMVGAAVIQLCSAFGPPAEHFLSQELKNFLFGFILLSTGACVGTWLSFSLRRVILSFNDLILLEPDRLYPFGRLIFVILLTGIIGLILNLEWVKISIAGNPVNPVGNLKVSFLIGALCGIAERSLSGVITQKAEDLVGTIGKFSPKTGASE